MATITVSASGLTAAEGRGLIAVLAAENARRASENPPGVPLADGNDYLASVLVSAVASYAEQNAAEGEDAADVKAFLRTATDEQVAELKAVLAKGK